MAQQQHVSYYLRAALVDWLVEVCEVYRFRPHTVRQTFGIISDESFDTSLSSYVIPPAV